MSNILVDTKINCKNLLVFLISIFPISLLVGSSVINGLIIIIDLLFLFLIIKEKNLKFLKNKTFYILLIFMGNTNYKYALKLTLEILYQDQLVL